MNDVSTVLATASAVTNREISRKADGRKFTLYTVETDRGDFTTTRRELAERAYRLTGQQVMFHVKTEQRGEYTNYYLEDIETPDMSGGGFGQQQQQAFTPPQQQNGFDPQPASFPPPKPPDAGTPTNKDVFIFRQTAAKVAGQISRTPEEFWSNVDAIAAYFIDGTKPAAYATVGQAADDDIPF